MATLILSTVGTALGGPIGGLLGTMIGGAIDQQLFGGGPRQGPRLGDLSVQTSSYGTRIPRVYGTMRVAGTVIWSTDLVETSQLAGDGKSGPQTEVYSYSASFAVALSSREASSVRRIWADGKLIRGTAGDLKVDGVFRFLPGTEGQTVDPLIGAIEGIGAAPAYRGLALAVFEDLQLGPFGNRIPVLTFELIASEQPETIGAILRDGSDGCIDSSDGRSVDGYALHGSDLAGAVAPLVEAYAMELVDDGDAFRDPNGLSVTAIGDGLSGASVGADGGTGRIERRIQPASRVPSALSLTYYEKLRDFQSGQARASIAGNGLGERSISLPCVVEAGAAKTMADQLLAREWATRERLRAALPPCFLNLRPGDALRFHAVNGTWLIESVGIERAVVNAECRPVWSAFGTRAADPGRALDQPDVVALPSKLVVLDLPPQSGASATGPSLQVAVASPSDTYRRIPLQIDVAGVVSSAQSAPGEAVIGDVAGVAPDGETDVVDAAHVIDVTLANPDHWLVSADEATLAAGGNLAALGDEIIQFASAEPVGQGQFRLSGLRRGLRESESAMTGHIEGEAFVLLNEASLTILSFTEAQVGQMARITALGVGNGASPPFVERVITG